MVVSTFNRPDLCARAVQSALRQTVVPLEVIVCDDGSPGGAPVFADERVRVVRLPHVGSPAPARNHGVESARGDWIAFLDDDDEWLPDKLELQLRHGADVISSAARRVDGSVYSPYVGAVSRRRIYVENVLVLATVMVRRRLGPRFREEPRLAGIEDYLCWLDLADRGARIVCTPDVVATYDDRHGTRLSDDAIGGELRIAGELWGRLRRRPSDPATAIGFCAHASKAARLIGRRIASPGSPAPVNGPH